jgi:hypothetical protein
MRRNVEQTEKVSKTNKKIFSEVKSLERTKLEMFFFASEGDF